MSTLDEKLRKLAELLAPQANLDPKAVLAVLKKLPQENQREIDNLPESAFSDPKNSVEQLPTFIKKEFSQTYTPDYTHQKSEINAPTPKPSSDSSKKFNDDFDLYLEDTFGPGTAKDTEFKENIAALLAHQTAKLALQPEASTSPSTEPSSTPTLTELIDAERRGVNPQLESYLKSLLSMMGANRQNDILYGAEMPIDIRKKLELLGHNPNGETFYANALKSLGIDQLPPSLISEENLQAQAPSKNALDTLYSSVEPLPNKKSGPQNR